MKVTTKVFFSSTTPMDRGLTAIAWGLAGVMPKQKTMFLASSIASSILAALQRLCVCSDRKQQ